MSSNNNLNKEKSSSRLDTVKSSSSSYKQYRRNKQKKLKVKSKSKSQIIDDRDDNRHKSCNVMRLLTKEYLLNKYNLLRFVVLIVALVLVFVCMLYGVGSVTTLELEDLWCPEQYTWDEVTQHNRENNRPLGTDDCYVAGKLRADVDELFGADSSQTAFVPAPLITAPAIFKLILYTGTWMVLVWILVKYTLSCLVDCRKAVNDEWYVLYINIFEN